MTESEVDHLLLLTLNGSVVSWDLVIDSSFRVVETLHEFSRT